jgi:CHAT domain-containing protein
MPVCQLICCLFALLLSFSATMATGQESPSSRPISSGDYAQFYKEMMLQRAAQAEQMFQMLEQEEAKGADERSLLDSYFQVGFALQSGLKLQRALQAYERYIEICDQFALQQEGYYIAAALNTGRLHLQFGDLDKAWLYQEKAQYALEKLKLQESASAVEVDLLALRLSHLLGDQSRYQQALSRISELMLGTKLGFQEKARVYQTFLSDLMSVGEMELWLVGYDEFLSQSGQGTGMATTEAGEAAIVEFMKARTVYMTTGDRESYLQSMDAVLKADGVAESMRWQVISGKGTQLLADGFVEEATPLIESASEYFTRIKTPTNVADSYLHLAEAWSDREDLLKTREYMRKAQESYALNPGINDWAQSTYHQHLAKLLIRLEQWAEAETHLDLAEPGAESNSIAGRFAKNPILISRLQLTLATGHNEEARRLEALLYDNITHPARLTLFKGAGFSGTAPMFQDLVDIYARLILICADCYLDRAFSVWQIVSSGSVDQALEDAWLADKTVDPRHARVVREKRYVESVMVNSDVPEEVRLQAAKRVENLQKELAAFSRESAPNAQSPFVTVKAVQARLEPDQILLQFLRGRKHYRALVIGPDRAQVLETVANPRLIDMQVASLAASLQPDFTGLLPDYRHDMAHDLYAGLFKNTIATIPDKADIYLVPDDALSGVPFSALLTTPLQTDASGDTAVPWLGRQFAFTVLPSARSISLMARPDSGSVGSRFFGVGNPTYDNSPESPFQEFQSLPDAEVELRSLGKLLGQDKQLLLLGDEANEVRLKAIDLSQFNYLAFATHGVLSPGASGNLKPGLLLATPKESTADNDGFLDMTDIMALRLNADLVMLSACNTTGGRRSSANYLEQMSSGFFHAGARAMLISRWEVDSAAAVKLTTAMAEYLKKQPEISQGKALNSAMLALADGESDWSHPHFWAPFMYMGLNSRIR